MNTRWFLGGVLATVMTFQVVAPRSNADDAHKNPSTPTAESDAVTPSPMTVKSVLNDIHDCNQKEIAFGTVAAAQGSSDAVKAFAQTIVTDHQNADTEVIRIAKEQNVEVEGTIRKTDPGPTDPQKDERLAPNPSKGAEDHPTPQDNPSARDTTPRSAPVKADYDAQLEELRSCTGADFDKKFFLIMEEDHEQALALFDQVKQNDKLTVLHPLVDKLRPIVANHEKVAQDLSKAKATNKTAARKP